MGESFSLTLTWGERTSFELIKNRKKGDKKKISSASRHKADSHPVPHIL